MHWYADFHDPPLREQATLFQWAGGFPALLRLTRRFYEVHVPSDPLLAALFSQMSPDHPQRVASWLGQVFGGPPAYSDRYGEYDRMISQHLDRALTPEQRARWVLLLARSADEVGLPADPEFRAAFTAYLEWGSRIAVENSQPGFIRRPTCPSPAGGGYATPSHGHDPTPPKTPSRTSLRRNSRTLMGRSPSRPTSDRCSVNVIATRCASLLTSGPTTTSLRRSRRNPRAATSRNDALRRCMALGAHQPLRALGLHRQTRLVSTPNSNTIYVSPNVRSRLPERGRRDRRHARRAATGDFW
jgi:truncated hemoglobin YjbI